MLIKHCMAILAILFVLFIPEILGSKKEWAASEVAPDCKSRELDSVAMEEMDPLLLLTTIFAMVETGVVYYNLLKEQMGEKLKVRGP